VQGRLGPDLPLAQADQISHQIEQAVLDAVPSARQVHSHAHA
jgi:hypothetical protein